MAAYLHKKFKKFASAETQQQQEKEISENVLPDKPVSDVRSTLHQKTPSPTPAAAFEGITPIKPHFEGITPLKHSVGSMVGLGGHRQQANVCPFCHVVCPKPSVLEKHIRTHTNERPYPCESCKFAFKTKSNLYKHFKSRSHVLRIEKGIESSGAEILAELGDGAKEELEGVNYHAPALVHPGDHAPTPLHHPLPRLPETGGLVLLPSHLVKPGIITPHPTYPPYHLFPQQPHPGLRFLEPGHPPPILNGHPPPQPPPEAAFPPQHIVRHVRPQISPQHHPHPREHPRPHPYDLQPERLSRDSHTTHPSESSSSSSPASSKKSSSHINAEFLEQRINKVISANQAIVDTLDPLWKTRYMRQSSREDVASKERSRRSSTSVGGQETSTSSIPQPSSSFRAQPAPEQSSAQNLSLSSVPVNFATNNVHHQPQQPLRPERPDSNIPLNLSDTGDRQRQQQQQDRKRKSPETVVVTSSSLNPLIDAQTVKEVWLNSQKKTGNISHLEDIASKIEAKLRSSENPFHPDNPEGSIIKDLLLKTRAGHILVASSELKDKLNESDNNLPINLQISPKTDHPRQSTVGIPIPKNFLPPHTKAGHTNVETSLYQCNLCMVTFKSLESIEIHQSHYCKNTKHPPPSEPVIQRPNSTVTQQTRDHPHHQPRDLHVSRTSPSVGDRRKPEFGLVAVQGEPPVKRSRVDSYPSTIPANVTVTREQNIGLLQIAAGTRVMTTTVSTTISTIPGIPTPNLSGVLTGIKSQPLFSLPGVRSVDPRVSVVSEVTASVTKPVFTVSETETRPGVTFVLGIPGPTSHSLPAISRPAPAAGQLGPVSVPSIPVVRAQPVQLTNTHLKIETSSTRVDILHPSSSIRPQLVFNSPQRKYEFAAATTVTSTGPLDSLPSSSGPQVTSSSKPERPDSLALPPGALFKKKEVAISGSTLVSPETPRPKKAYVLSYQNGTAYTFLGLKCSTRLFFCSSHKPQPNYVQLEPNSRQSMYSNWQVVFKDSHPSGLSPKDGMSAYNSINHHEQLYGIYSTAAPKKSVMITTHSSRWHEKKSACHTVTASSAMEAEKKSAPQSSEDAEGAKPVRTVEGGYKSADDNYTYIRGRGRGKYICDTCGIRCKKPSMLKKHIRTHTNVRPYTCKYCNFSFKTKGNLTKHMKSKAHSKKCVELGIVPVPTTADDQQMDDSKSSGDIAFAGDSDTDDCDDADDMDEDDDDGDAEEQFDDAGTSSGNKAAPSSEEDSSSMLGLAPRIPRFATYPFSSTPSPMASGGAGVPPPTASVNDGSCLPGPDSVSVPAIVPVSKMSEYEQLSRNSRLVEEKMILSSTDPVPSSSKIWSIANMTDGDQAASRPRFLELHPQDPVSNKNVRQNAADILSPVTESATILSYIDKTSCKVQRVPDLESPVDMGLKNYLQERAAIRAKQNSMSYDGPEFPPNKIVIKEEQNIDVTDKLDNIKKTSGTDQFPHNYSHTDTIPQNVTMNVKDMPPIQNGVAASNPPPEFNIPHISKADSPMRKPLTSSSASSAPTAPASSGVASSCSDMKIRTPESINQSSGAGVIGARSSDSPASNSSQDNDGAGGGAKSDSEKGSMISNPQEIFQTNEEGKSVCGICKKVFSKPSQLRLHVNIHYFERPFRCDACAVSFRTKGHLQKHKRSVGHFNKVNINATFGAPSTDNPRPFKCGDCMIAFRIHGHLAKHLRSKMHIMKLECIGKLPIGMYAEMERLGTNLNEIDTTDCENSLESLQQIAVKLYEKDPSKLTSMDEPLPTVSTSSDLSDEEDSNLAVSDIKEEPVEIVPNMTAVIHDSIVPNMIAPGSRQSSQPPPGHLRQSFSSSGVSGHEDHSTDSDTEASSHVLKCGQCGQSFSDMKSLQIHSFLEHHHQSPNHQSRSRSPPAPPPGVINLSRPAHHHHAPATASPDLIHVNGPVVGNPVPCHICGVKLPNQAIFQQHLQTHAVFRPYICSVCDAGFTSPLALESHSKLHS